VTSIVNTIRDLIALRPVSSGIWIALAWCTGVLVVAYVLAMASYHRKVA
jgi:ABC-2 type transport system permease protein